MKKWLISAVAASALLTAVSCQSFDDKESLDTQKTISPQAAINAAAYQPLAGCDNYLIGAGSADMTGCPSNQPMGGYEEAPQDTAGIYTRQIARAFIMASAQSPDKRIAIVTVDDWALPLSVSMEIVKRLSAGTLKNALGKDVDIKDSNGNPLYNFNNIMITASHTHSGVAGHDRYTMYNISSSGFNPQHFELTVSGIVDAILEAHSNIEPATIEMAKSEMIESYNVNSNRSMEAHLNNKTDNYMNISIADYEKLSQVEKDKLRNDPKAVNKTMYLLKFKAKDGRDIGALNWFSVHGTSMSASNHLISGDNKAVAQLMFENMMGADYKNSKDFVAAFAQGALGDVDSNRKILYKDKFAYKEFEEHINIAFSAVPQAARAMEMYTKPQAAVKGDIRFAHEFVTFSQVQISPEYQYKPGKYPTRTAPPVIGMSMAAGAEINPTNLWQSAEGMTTENGKHLGWAVGLHNSVKNGPNTAWDIGRVLFMDKEIQQLQAPKPVLLYVGNALPSWAPQTLPLQIFKIGNIAVVGIPFETTTAAARRICRVVKDEFKRLNMDVTDVIYAGNTNAYCSYMSTPEEYEMQHYEGGSTLFGINELPAAEQETVRLCNKMAAGQTGRVAGDPEWIKSVAVDADYTNILTPNTPVDLVAAGTKFGMQTKPMKVKDYSAGQTVSVEFYASNMNNDTRRGKSFMYVQRWVPEADAWMNITDDSDFNTSVKWFGTASGQYSKAAAEWRVKENAVPGKYRILFNGGFRKSKETIIPYSGISETFSISENTVKPVLSGVKEVAADGKSIKIFELVTENPVNANKMVIRAAENTGAVPASGTIELDDGTIYPFRNMSGTGEGKILYFPTKMVKKVVVRIDSVSGDPAQVSISEISLF